MPKLITLPFNYSDREYVLLIQYKKEKGFTNYRVTAITEDAHAKLYANYTFAWNGKELTLVNYPKEKIATHEFNEELRLALLNNVVLNEEF